MSNEITSKVFDSRATIEPRLASWRAFVDGETDVQFFYGDPEVYLTLADAPGTQPLAVELWRGDRLVGLGLGLLEPSKLNLTFSIKKVASFKVKRLRFPGHDLILSLDEDRPALARAYLDIIVKHNFDLFILPELRQGSPLLSVLLEAGERHNSLSIFRTAAKDDLAYRGHFKSSYAEYMAAFGSKRRNDINRLLKPWRADEKSRVEEYRSVASIPEYLTQLDKLVSETWQGRVGKAHKRDTPDNRRLLELAAKHNWLRSFIMFDGDRPIAFTHAFQYRGIYTLEDVGYDQAYVKRAPGAALNHLIIERLHNVDPPKAIDIGVGENHYKHYMSDTEIPVTQLGLTSKRWVLSVHNLQIGLHSAYLQGREFVTRMGWEKTLRDWLKKRQTE